MEMSNTGEHRFVKGERLKEIYETILFYKQRVVDARNMLPAEVAEVYMNSNI